MGDTEIDFLKENMTVGPELVIIKYTAVLGFCIS